MKRVRQRLNGKPSPWMLALAAMLLSPQAAAASSAQASAEIAQLIAMLGDSKCRFQRNGSWHEAAEARAHLQRKYDYLMRKDQVDSAEQFIERAASSKVGVPTG